MTDTTPRAAERSNATVQRTAVDECSSRLATELASSCGELYSYIDSQSVSSTTREYNAQPAIEFYMEERHSV